MKLIRIQETTNEPEHVISTWALTSDQYHMLLNYAINDLITKGLIEISDMTPEALDELQKEMLQDTIEVFGKDIAPTEKEKLN